MGATTIQKVAQPPPENLKAQKPKNQAALSPTQNSARDYGPKEDISYHGIRAIGQPPYPRPAHHSSTTVKADPVSGNPPPSVGAPPATF